MARNANNNLTAITMHHLVSSMPVDGNWAHAAVVSFEVDPQHKGHITVWTTAGMNGARHYLSSHRKVMTLANARKLWAACRRSGWVTNEEAYLEQARQYEMIADMAQDHNNRVALGAA